MQAFENLILGQKVIFWRNGSVEKLICFLAKIWSVCLYGDYYGFKVVWLAWEQLVRLKVMWGEKAWNAYTCHLGRHAVPDKSKISSIKHGPGEDFYDNWDPK